RPAAASAHPTPIAVTRFQVALNVDGTLPPTDAIEFRPRQLPYRPRVEPRIVSDQEPGASAYDEPGTPAMIVDRPSDPLRERHAVPGATAGELRQRPQDVAVGDPDRPGEPLPAIDQRTPGSALVLPANPLQDLSDESIEGFVDCTLYEESGNFFHPAAEDGEWNDALADPPAAPPTKRSTGPSTVPAMPYETAPDLTVLARGNTESLRVAPDAPPAAPPVLPLQAMPQQAMPQQAMPQQAMPQQAMPQMPQSTSSPAQSSSDASFAPPWPDAANASGPAYPTYPTVDASQYAPQYATPQPSQSRAQPVALPEPETLRLAPMWPRWLIIGGTALAAIVVAFILARLVRGSPRAETDRAIATRAAPSSTGTAGPAPNRSASDPSASSRSASGSPASGSPASGSPVSSPTANGSGRSGDPASPDDEDGGVVGPGGAPVVGHGPCRFNVATTPAGSIVRLDDQAMGPSPLTIDATCEKHRVDLSHARYQTVTRWVTLAVDKPQDLEVNLPRPIHAVTVTSFPPGAELSIDGRRAGTTPTMVQMMGFATVNLTFSKAGFQSVTKKVYSKLAQDHVFVKLMK
ncbi:MAG TPA: PEGA domain-containing protein, partial [Kofleriaceae bacterium]